MEYSIKVKTNSCEFEIKCVELLALDISFKEPNFLNLIFNIEYLLSPFLTMMYNYLIILFVIDNN